MTTARAKIFQNGGSQAVRLPKSVRFPEGQKEVLVRREGNLVILEAVPSSEWPKEFLAVLGAWKGDIPRPKQRLVSEHRDVFGPLRAARTSRKKRAR